LTLFWQGYCFGSLLGHWFLQEWCFLIERIEMSYEKDDCIACGAENATMIVWPSREPDYNKVCNDFCYQSLGEEYEERHNKLSW